MPYSPTRNTIKSWGKYWSVPGRLAYTYITDGPNDFSGGYYVFVGPPVSMGTRYVNEVVDQYNTLSPTAKIYTYTWCQSDIGVKDLQDHIDCAILNVL